MLTCIPIRSKVCKGGTARVGNVPLLLLPPLKTSQAALELRIPPEYFHIESQSYQYEKINSSPSPPFSVPTFNSFRFKQDKFLGTSQQKAKLIQRCLALKRIKYKSMCAEYKLPMSRSYIFCLQMNIKKIKSLQNKHLNKKAASKKTSFS